jgi:predicted MFS family arabinose efflux permease
MTKTNAAERSNSASFLDLVRDRTFTKIWIAIFTSAISTFFLLMTISARVLLTSSSTSLANLVVLTQWLPALIALPFIKFISSQLAPRKALMLADIGCAIVCLLLLLTRDGVFAQIALLLIRGCFDSLSKVVRTGALREYFHGELLDRAASYYNTALLVGGGVGSIFGALAFSALPPAAIMIFSAALYATSASLYATLPENANAAESRPSLATNASDATSVDHIYRAGLYYISSVGFFQGYHNLARTAFPVKQLGLGVDFVPVVQLLANFSYIVGAFLAAQVLLRTSYRALPAILHFATIVLLASFPFLTDAAPGLFVYTLFGLFFEIGFCLHLRFAITRYRKDKLAPFVANINAIGMAIMVVIAYGGSLMVDKIGFSVTTFLIAGVAAMVPFVAESFPLFRAKHRSKVSLSEY